MILYTLRNKNSGVLGNPAVAKTSEEVKNGFVELLNTNLNSVFGLIENHEIVEIGSYDLKKGVEGFTAPHKVLFTIKSLLTSKQKKLYKELIKEVKAAKPEKVADTEIKSVKG